MIRNLEIEKRILKRLHNKKQNGIYEYGGIDWSSKTEKMKILEEIKYIKDHKINLNNFYDLNKHNINKIFNDSFEVITDKNGNTISRLKPVKVNGKIMYDGVNGINYKNHINEPFVNDHITNYTYITFVIIFILFVIIISIKNNVFVNIIQLFSLLTH